MLYAQAAYTEGMKIVAMPTNIKMFSVKECK